MEDHQNIIKYRGRKYELRNKIVVDANYTDLLVNSVPCRVIFSDHWVTSALANLD